MAKKKAKKVKKAVKPAKKAAPKKAAKKVTAKKAPARKMVAVRRAPVVIRKATPVTACACPAPAQSAGLVLIGRVTVPGPRISVSSVVRR